MDEIATVLEDDELDSFIDISHLTVDFFREKSLLEQASDLFTNISERRLKETYVNIQ